MVQVFPILIHLACITAFFFPVTLPCILIALLLRSKNVCDHYFTTATFPTARSRPVDWFSLLGLPSHAVPDNAVLYGGCPPPQASPPFRYGEGCPLSNAKNFFWSHTLWFMTDYAVPTFKGEVRDWLKFKELNSSTVLTGSRSFSYLRLILFGRIRLVSVIDRAFRSDHIDLGLFGAHHSIVPRNLCRQFDRPPVWVSKV